MTQMPAETTSSYRCCQLLLFWSCFVDPDHVPLTSGGKQLSDMKISTYNLALDLQGLFLGSVWHEKCQRRQDFNPPSACFFIGSLLQDGLCHWVSVPHVSLLTGSHQDAVAMENVQLKQMSTPPPISQFPGRTCMLFWWKTRNVTLSTRVNMCVRDGCTCTHMYSKWDIRERQGRVFFLTEKVGRFIVQPCVLVHTWACICTVLLQVCVGALAWLFENSLLM